MGKKETLTEKINLRWLAVAIFLIALIPIILVPIYISIPERIYGPIIAGYSLGGAAILIYIMLRPYLRRRKRMNNGSTLDDYELENEAKEKITFEVFWNYLFPKFKWNKLESITKQETKEKIRKVLDDGVIVEFDDITCMVKDEPDLTSHVSSEATLYGLLNRNVIQLKVTLSNKQLDMAVDEFEDL